MNGRVFLQVGGFTDFPCPPQKRRLPWGQLNIQNPVNYFHYPYLLRFIP